MQSQGADVSWQNLTQRSCHRERYAESETFCARWVQCADAALLAEDLGGEVAAECIEGGTYGLLPSDALPNASCM